MTWAVVLTPDDQLRVIRGSDVISPVHRIVVAGAASRRDALLEAAEVLAARAEVTARAADTAIAEAAEAAARARTARELAARDVRPDVVVATVADIVSIVRRP